MAEERPKVKSLKLKKESGGSELLKSALKRPPSSGGTPDRKETGTNSGFSKGKEVRTIPGNSSSSTPTATAKEPIRSSSFGKNLVKVAKEIANSKEGKGVVGSKEGKAVGSKPEQRASLDGKSPSKVVLSSSKPSTKVGTPLKDLAKSPIKKDTTERRVSVKDEVRSPIKASSIKKDTTGRLLVKDELRSPIKVSSSSKEAGGKGVTKEREKGNNANGKEQGKSVVNGKERSGSATPGSNKEVGKTNGKSSSKVKEEDRELYREKEKGKSLAAAAKSPLSKTTPVKKPESAAKSITKTGPSPTGVQVRKQMMKTTTTTMTATKTVTEQKKEKKVFELPGQKHDPPEERDALRIFYTTLREQMPESEMAEVWLMEYGLLPADEAQKAFQRKQKRTQSSKQGGPSSKVSTPVRLSNGSPGVKKSTPVSNGKGSQAVGSANAKANKKKRPSNLDSDSDDDFLQNVMTKNKKKLKI